MKRFPMLNAIMQLLIALTVGIIEKIFVLLYCMLPMGLFMLLMSLRDKNHKVTALSTFTTENSEFQHIFPNYILVIIEPKFFKRGVNKRIKSINDFCTKYRILLILSLIVLFSGLWFWLYFNK